MSLVEGLSICHYDMIEDQDAYMSAGVDEILTKPVFADKIKRIIAIAQQKKRRIPDP
jgi:CheY-like chemotaxis protein